MCCRDASTGRIFAAAILAASFLLAGCTTCRVAFTREIREQYLPESEDLKKLQYYLSDDITLQREFVRGDAEVSKGHKLVTKETGLVEEVIVRARTPGVATEVGDTYIAISFEPGKSLYFGSPPRIGIPSGNTSSSRTGGPTRTGKSPTTAGPSTPWGEAGRRTSRSSWIRSTR